MTYTFYNCENRVRLKVYGRDGVIYNCIRPLTYTIDECLEDYCDLHGFCFVSSTRAHHKDGVYNGYFSYVGERSRVIRFVEPVTVRAGETLQLTWTETLRSTFTTITGHTGVSLWVNTRFVRNHPLTFTPEECLEDMCERRGQILYEVSNIHPHSDGGVNGSFYWRRP